MKTKFTLPLTSTILGGLGLYARNYYWRQWLPRFRFRQLQAALRTQGHVSGGWIDHRPLAVARGDVLTTGYSGGITLNARVYSFTLAADGTLLHWQAI